MKAFVQLTKMIYSIIRQKNRLVFAFLSLMSVISERVYSQAAAADSVYTSHIGYVRFFNSMFDVTTASDIIAWLRNDTEEKDVFFREHIANNSHNLRFRYNVRNGLDIFYKDTLSLCLSPSYSCYGVSDLRGDGDVIDWFYVLTSDSVYKRLCYAWYRKDGFSEAFSELHNKLMNDTSLIFDIETTERWRGELKEFYDLSRSEKVKNIRLHPWVYEKNVGLRRECSCDTETCPQQIEGMSRILCEMCDTSNVVKIWFLGYNYRKKNNNYFVDKYIARFPRLRLPCVIAGGKLQSQYCNDDWLTSNLSSSNENKEYCASDTYLPEHYIGSFELDGVYVTVKKQLSDDVYKINTFDNNGKTLYCKVIPNYPRKANIIIMRDGSIFDINADVSYIICPSGRIETYEKREERFQ